MYDFCANLLERAYIFLLHSYRWVVAPIFMFMGTRCRFSPSCSQYSEEAVKKWGLFNGLGLSIKRLSRCHPFCDGGHDPVPMNE